MKMLPKTNHYAAAAATDGGVNDERVCHRSSCRLTTDRVQVPHGGGGDDDNDDGDDDDDDDYDSKSIFLLRRAIGHHAYWPGPGTSWW